MLLILELLIELGHSGPLSLSAIVGTMIVLSYLSLIAALTVLFMTVPGYSRGVGRIQESGEAARTSLLPLQKRSVTEDSTRWI